MSTYSRRATPRLYAFRPPPRGSTSARDSIDCCRHARRCCARHAYCADEDEAQRPDDVEVEPTLRDEPQSQPFMNGEGDNSATNDHRGSVDKRDGDRRP